MNDPIDLLENFFRGATSSEEERALMEWLRDKTESDPELAGYYLDKWSESDGKMDERLKARIHARIRERIDAESAASPVQAPRRRLFRRILPWAGAACIAAAAFAGWFSYAKILSRQGGELFEIYTEKGQKTNVLLPDGTRVWLNSDSRLSYDGRYNLRRREVNLTGEGYFEVAKDPDRRFRVHTDNYTVEALGTAFNIKSYPGDAASVTTLFEGRVRIGDGEDFSATLSPMQALVYDKAANRFTRGDSDRAAFAALWRNNELIVESGTTLEMLTEMLSREYNMHFVFRSERIKQLRFEGIIKDNNLHNVLQLICLSGEVTHTIEDNTVVLDEKR